MLTLNALKWENTVHAMGSSSSGIKQFIQVNYDSETIECEQLNTYKEVRKSMHTRYQQD